METEEVGVIKANWAESLERVLSEEQPKHKNYLVLSKFKESKAKTDQKNSGVGFEIEGEIKVKKDNSGVQEKISKATENRINRRKKFEIFKGLRIKPDKIKDKNRELVFKKIATRGVVQLFNAVQAQQKDITKRVESEKLDHKRDEILNNINKRVFLDVLMGGPKAKSELVDNPVKNEKKEEDTDSEDEPGNKNGPTKSSTWNVLKDNFMFANKKTTKNWDQEEDSDEEEDMADNESS